MKEIKDTVVFNQIKKTLEFLEKENEIVICSTESERTTKKLYGAITDMLPKTNLTEEEMSGVRSLILHAIRDKNFFDAEMPTLTGFTSEEFQKIADKFPRE